jgi:hypothetical protein
MSKSLIKLIKKAERESPEVRSEVESVVDPNKWSRAVRSWVTEFQKNARSDSQPAFDRLFRTANQRQC